MASTPELPVDIRSAPKSIRIRIQSQYGELRLDATELHVEEQPDHYAVRAVIGEHSAFLAGLDWVSDPSKILPKNVCPE